MNDTVRNWVGILGVCLVFALGMISGAAVTVQILRARTEQAVLSGHVEETIMGRVGQRLSARLDCDPQQQEQLHAILLDARRNLHQARQQIAPQLRQVFGETAGRIRSILRDDQRKTFDAMMARTRAHQSLANLVPAEANPSPVATPH